ncbi:SDR family oxidoreductase [Aestuariibius insulae]|uniref:SDR family oxidoreductase n=1 Tax=Aestuariibius insulae TaxID=2058287 RepID=UPI00345E2323
MIFNLRGQHVLIVGGSSGIGFAVARAALDLGARVTLAGRSMQRLAIARTGLQAAPAILALDATDREGTGAALAKVDPIDHLVLTAGGGSTDGPVAEIGWQGLADTMTNKLGAQVTALAAALPHLTESASVTLTSGAASRSATPGMGALTATNAAIEALTRTLAVELAPCRVNVVSPGLVDTPGLATLAGDGKDAMLKNTAAVLPVGFVAKPEHIAPLYLAAITSRYVTGAVLDANGGALL